MSSPAATAAKRSRTARARRTRRRRRWALFGIVVIGLLILGVVLAMPTFQRAVDELGLPLQDQSIIRQQAAEKHLDPALIAGVIYAETKFDARSSSAGAQGLMQLMPETAQFLARRSGAHTFTTADLSAPEVNIAYGSYYLRYLIDRYHGNTMLALAAYNAGEANVDRWVTAAKDAGHSLTIDEIPFPETRAYVQRVFQAQQRYRHTYPSQLGYQ
jgi:soluble lytic murein transglycosylase